MEKEIKAEVEVIYYDCDVEAKIYANGEKPFSNEGFEAFAKYTKDNNISYYSECKEDFSIALAVGLAKAEGNTKVIVENLS